MTEFMPNLGPKGHGVYRLLRFFNGGLVRRFLRDLEEPEVAAKRQFNGLLSLARDSSFFHDNGAQKITTLQEYREAIPVRGHRDFKPWLDRVALGEPSVLVKEPTTMLLETSGTTGTPKHLPVTSTWAKHVQQAQRLWTLGLVRDHPTLQSGKALTMVSPAVHGVSPAGIPIGSNTGRIRAAQPGWLKNRYAVPDIAMEIDDPIARQYAVLRFGLAADVRSITTANPSLLLLLFRRLIEWKQALSQDLKDGTLRCGPAAALNPELRLRLERHLNPSSVPDDWRPEALWDLASVNCWTGGPARYFADRLATVLPNVPIRELGVTASEGSFAFPLASDWPGSVLWTGGHLMEFIAADGTLKWPWELVKGDHVRLIVSTAGGLFRYDMADELEVVGHCLNTPMVRFTGKAGRYLNVSGERVSAEQVSEAVTRMGVDLAGFTVGAERGDIPVYVIAVEGKSVPREFAERFDQSLAELNVEYASKRKSGRIGNPKLVMLNAGHYAEYRARRVKEGAPEGQLKDPILAIDDGEWFTVTERGGYT